MTFLRREAVSLLSILLAASLSLLAYPWLPPRVLTHWGIYGTADAFAPRNWAVVLNPAGMVVAYGFFAFVRYADKSRAARLQELGIFDPLRHGAVLFFGFAHALAMGTGLGWVDPGVNFLIASASFFVLLVGRSPHLIPTEALNRFLGALNVATTDDARSAFFLVPTFAGSAGLLGACIGPLQWLGGVLVLAIGIVLLRRRHPEHRP